MTGPDRSTLDRLPCGCLMGNDEVTQAFVFIPHALDCQYYLYVLEQAGEQGKPIITMDAR